MEVLRAKHPEDWTPTVVILYLYPNRPPELTTVEITNVGVHSVE